MSTRKKLKLVQRKKETEVPIHPKMSAKYRLGSTFTRLEIRWQELPQE